MFWKERGRHTIRILESKRRITLFHESERSDSLRKEKTNDDEAKKCASVRTSYLFRVICVVS